MLIYLKQLSKAAGESESESESVSNEAAMKPRKVYPRKKVRIELPLPASAPRAPPTPRRTRPPPPSSPPPAKLFPNYPSPDSTSSTPLPPPSMPRKRFHRRILPLVLVGSATYLYLRTLNKGVTEKEEKFGLEVSIPAQSTETTSP